MQPVPEFAHPPDPSTGIAHPQFVRPDFPGDHSTGTDKAVFSDVVPTYNGCIGPDGCTPPDTVRIYCPRRLIALRGLITLVKTIDGPRKTSSSQVTPV